jgi:hypothetical protein
MNPSASPGAIVTTCSASGVDRRGKRGGNRICNRNNGRSQQREQPSGKPTASICSPTLESRFTTHSARTISASDAWNYQSQDRLSSWS